MEEIPGHIDDDEYLAYLRDAGLGHLLHIHGVRHLGYQLPQRSLLDASHHGSAWVARESCRFIEVNRNRPWFLWASWIAPHPPANVSDAYADLYRNRPLPAVAGLSGSEAPEFRRFRELYFAAITQADHAIGQLLAHLEYLGLAPKTLVIFTSDHGEMAGDLGLWTKELPYEASVRVPMVLRWPGRISAGIIQRQFADLNDILPTLLDAAGIDIRVIAQRHGLSCGFPGASLLSLNSPRDRTHQYAQWGDLTTDNPRWIMVRNHEWKYIYWFGTGEEELFDIRRDPHETRNLANTANPAVTARLRKLRRLAIT